MIIAADLMLGATGIVADGWVAIDGDLVTDAGVGARDDADETVDGLLCPGFVDVHSHGGGGAGFGDGLEDARKVLSTHLAQGTTTMVASLVTGPMDGIEASVRELAPLVDAGELAGIHLEGPWLAASFKGAHEPSWLRDPVLADVQRLVGAGPVRLVTIAPELPGAMVAIEWLAAQGVVVAVGHTAADATCTRAAISAGAIGATHLFNAMPPMLHRIPGPVLPLWRTPDVWVELICDGVHVDVELVAHVVATKSSRVVFITDAMAAAGVGDGDYHLGGRHVEVRGGVARLAGSDTIAGSTLTLSRAVQVAVAAGTSIESALRAATCNPADYLGLAGVGRLKAGNFADLVVLDDALRVTRVMRRGVWQ